MIDRLRDKLIKPLTPTPSLEGSFDSELWLHACDIHAIIYEDLRERDEAYENEPNMMMIPNEFRDGGIQPDSVCSEMAALDFCVSELKCDDDSEIWQTFQSIVNNCWWIASYQELCVVCDRPSILTFDEQHKLHGEDKPAIQFVDGYSVYACHGERISKFE